MNKEMVEGLVSACEDISKEYLNNPEKFKSEIEAISQHVSLEMESDRKQTLDVHFKRPNLDIDLKKRLGVEKNIQKTLKEIDNGELQSNIKESLKIARSCDINLKEPIVEGLCMLIFEPMLDCYGEILGDTTLKERFLSEKTS